MVIPTLLRLAEHRALKELRLSGNVLDLGGDTRSEYRSLLGKNVAYTTVNINSAARPDILHDLETPLPLEDGTYDHVLLINVLEHIYSRYQLLQEATRVLKRGGSIVIVVPFYFPYHASPSDFWRLTHESLSTEAQQLGLKVVQCRPLGDGVFTARYVALDRLLPASVRSVRFYSVRYLAVFLDWALNSMARNLGKQYKPEDYALGYMVEARRV